MTAPTDLSGYDDAALVALLQAEAKRCWAEALAAGRLLHEMEEAHGGNDAVHRRVNDAAAAAGMNEVRGMPDVLRIEQLWREIFPDLIAVHDKQGHWLRRGRAVEAAVKVLTQP